MTRMLIQIGLVALGSALGGTLRALVGLAATRWLGTAFPYGTLFINISGSLFLGWFLTILAERWGEAPAGRADDLRLAIAVGFVGAYTTFSTFEWESHELLRSGNSLLGTGYILGSVLIGLLAVRAGVLLARAM